MTVGLNDCNSAPVNRRKHAGADGNRKLAKNKRVLAGAAHRSVSRHAAARLKFKFKFDRLSARE